MDRGGPAVIRASWQYKSFSLSCMKLSTAVWRSSWLDSAEVTTVNTVARPTLHFSSLIWISCEYTTLMSSFSKRREGWCPGAGYHRWWVLRHVLSSSAVINPPLQVEQLQCKVWHGTGTLAILIRNALAYLSILENWKSIILHRDLSRW